MIDNKLSTLQRIKIFIEYKGINNKKFEESVGFSNGAFASQLKNNRTIGVDKLENILSVYPELNVIWLLTGKGEMLNSPKKNNQTDTSDQCDENNIYKTKYYEILDKLVSVQEQLSKTQEKLIESQQKVYNLQQELEQLKDQGGDIVVGA